MDGDFDFGEQPTTRSKSSVAPAGAKFDKHQAKLAKLAKHKKLAKKKKKKASTEQQHKKQPQQQKKQLKERQSAEVYQQQQQDDALYDYGPDAQMYLTMRGSAGAAASTSATAAPKERKQPKPAKYNRAKNRQQLEDMMGYTQQQLYPSEQRKVCAMNATHLKNMLKLPKAHRWVFYEWFYSNLDRPLFLGPNDFQNCLRETFPLLRTRRLTRAQWSLVRKLLGKPRRCSPAFFAEERRALHERRDKIRSLQRRRSLKEGESVRELPDDLRVPMTLIIGTRVVARVRYPTDGLYAGHVDAIDGYNHCYRVTFDKQPLGTRSIPDYEVRSVLEQESIPLASYKANHQPSRALFTPARLLAQTGGQRPAEDAGKPVDLCQLVAASVTRSAQALTLNEEETFSGYALRFLLIVTRLMKMVEKKRRCLDDLCRLNDQAEVLVTAARPASLQLMHDYSACLLGLRRLNAELRPHLASAVQLASELGHERGFQFDPTLELKQKAMELSVSAVGRAEQRLNGGPLKNLKNTDLIAQLVGLLSLVRRIAERRQEEQDYGPVRAAIAEIKASLHSGNVAFFENNVEVHLQAVLTRLDEDAPLHAFHLRSSSNYF